MTDDLKKLAEAAKAAEDAFGVENARPSHDPHIPSDEWLEAYIAWGAASGSLHDAATPDAILNLIRERDEASALAEQATYQALALEGRAEAAEAALSAAREEVERYKIALADATRRPMGVLPDSAEGLITAADMEAAEKRRPKYATLTKEPHHG